MTTKHFVGALALGLLAGGSWGFSGGYYLGGRHVICPPPPQPAPCMTIRTDTLQMDFYDTPRLDVEAPVPKPKPATKIAAKETR